MRTKMRNSKYEKITEVGRRKRRRKWGIKVGSMRKSRRMREREREKKKDKRKEILVVIVRGGCDTPSPPKKCRPTKYTYRKCHSKLPNNLFILPLEHKVTFHTYTFTYKHTCTRMSMITFMYVSACSLLTWLKQ